MAYYRTPHDVTALPAWQALKLHRADMQHFSMRDAFNSNPKRFEDFTLSSCGLFLDYSKNLITDETRDLLVDLANEVDLKGAIKSLFEGEIVNASEGRPALHTALRRPVADKLSVNGVNIMPQVHKVLNQMTELVGRIHDGLWRGYTEKPITDIVNIGIGGSFLGPELVSEALLSYAQKGVAAPQAIVNPSDQFGHLVQNFVHLGHDVDAVHRQFVGYWAAQCGVQGRTTFGGVNDLAFEQRFDCTF